jgi:hypothetical protein
MTPQERGDLALRLETVVRAVPGVTNLYRSGSLVSHLIGDGAAALGVAGSGAPLITVTDGDGDVTVQASLGVAADAGSAATLRAVREAIIEAMVPRAVRVHLTVAYLHDRE